MPRAAVVTSPIKHGEVITGAVTKGSTTVSFNGNGIARVGDEVECSIHSKTTIIEGSAIYTADGLKVALVGHKCACGAEIASSPAEVEVAR